VLTFKRSSSGCCLCSMRMVCAPLTDGSRGGFQPAVHSVLRAFLHAFRSIHSAGGFLLHGLRGRSVTGRTVRGPIADGPLLMVQYYRFVGCFRTARCSHADSPPWPRGRYARCLRTVYPVSVDSPPRPRGRSARCLRTIRLVHG
jgi:hypothetical protein